MSENGGDIGTINCPILCISLAVHTGLQENGVCGPGLFTVECFG